MLATLHTMSWLSVVGTSTSSGGRRGAPIVAVDIMPPVTNLPMNLLFQSDLTGVGHSLAVTCEAW